MPPQQKKKGVGRHDPLHVQIQADKDLEIAATLKQKQQQQQQISASRKPKRPAARQQQSQRPGVDGVLKGLVPLGTSPGNGSDEDEEMDGAASFVDDRTSRKILAIVKDQQQEEEAAAAAAAPRRAVGTTNARGQQPDGMRKGPSSGLARVPPVPIHRMEDSDEDARDDEEEEEVEEVEWDEEGGFGGDIEVDEADAALMEKFMAAEPRRQMNLADLIMGKIAAAEAGEAAAANEADREARAALQSSGERPIAGFESRLDPKVVEVYGKVGLLLSRYRSGKLPKAFKIIPSLPNWEEVLFLTNPDGWTPHATYQATRVFASNLNARLAQKFFAHVLLDKVRTDIAETKKLNYHLYLALKKSLYKPQAFFKGLLFPLCDSGTCTLREAAIIGSVITKVSIPLLHSAAAILKIADMDYTGANSLFLRILLDKKYALPYKVVDALVFHFLRFRNDKRVLPVLWHQALLAFAQRYKADCTPEQKEAIMELVKVKGHPSITPEIRRELENSTCRGEMLID